MSPLFWLAAAAALVGVVAVTRTGPRGGNPVAGTRLMGMARIALIAGGVLCAALAALGAFRR